MYEPFYKFIQQLSPDFKIDVMHIEPLLKVKTIYKGEFLFQENDICEFVGFTLKGCLRTFFYKRRKRIYSFFSP